MGIQKQYLKNKTLCRVTFKIGEGMGNTAQKAHLVGEFNNWSTSATPMTRLKNGAFKATLDLEKGREYQFRYLLGQNHWENEPDADKQLPTPFGDSRNSVIAV
jgi:1,4-alpha-glucan branching enzyme